MALSVTELNDVKVYNLTSGKTLPQWLEQRQHRSLKKDEGACLAVACWFASPHLVARVAAALQTTAAASSSCRTLTLLQPHRRLL